MTKKAKPALQPLCSVCAAELADSGFRIKIPKTSWPRRGVCMFCGKTLLVHDAEITGAKRKKTGGR